MKAVIYVCAGLAMVAIAVVAAIAVALVETVKSLRNQIRTQPAREKKQAMDDERAADGLLKIVDRLEKLEQQKSQTTTLKTDEKVV